MYVYCVILYTFLIFEPLIHTLLLLVPVYMFGTRSKSLPFLYCMLFLYKKCKALHSYLEPRIKSALTFKLHDIKYD